MKAPLFYHKRPLFGLDIGSQTVKFLQLQARKDKATVLAYGGVATDDKIMKDGVITNIPQAAKLVDNMLANNCKGTLTTNRVVMSIPVSHVYTRVLTMPAMSRKELDSAVQLEVEQAVPVAVKNLYFDYEVTDTGDINNMLVRMVAAPRDIIDSYTAVCDTLGLDLALVQTNIRADAQLCSAYEYTSAESGYLIVDVGGNSIDIGILDTTLRVTGTVDKGGNNFTDAIARELNISRSKAHTLKVTKGIAAGKHQEKVLTAVTPILDEVVKEIKRMNRFYSERIQEGSVPSQILIVGGGANMPGLGDYLTNATRIACRVSSPWGSHISFGKLEPPEHVDLPRYLTCAGLALAKDEQVVGI